MGRSSKYVVTPGASDGDQVPLPWLVSTLLLLTSFTLYLLDQATDALTALLYFLDVSVVSSVLDIYSICYLARATCWRAA